GFAEGTAERWVVEQGIVPETCGTARLVEDRTLHHASINPADLRAFHQRNGANETGGPVLDTAQLFEQQAIVLRIGRVRAGKSRGIDPWRAAQGVHFQA